MTDPQAMTSTDAFAELGRINFRETELATALAKVADLARRTISGADEVSITLVGARGAHTAAYTGNGPSRSMSGSTSRVMVLVWPQRPPTSP
jgi:hypothetical protein